MLQTKLVHCKADQSRAKKKSVSSCESPEGNGWESNVLLGNVPLTEVTWDAWGWAGERSGQACRAGRSEF